MISPFEPLEPVPFAHGMLQDLLESTHRGMTPLVFSAVDESSADPSLCGAPLLEDEAVFSVSERARQVIAMVNAAREETAAAVREECARALEAGLEAERRRVEQLWEEYTRDRRDFFQQVERRVVELALAVARKVLAREAAVDAMHLTAIVRAALDRVQDESISRLRVPVSHAADWRALFARGDIPVEVIADDRLPAGTVRLETSVGQVELGVAAQLAEVEVGFGKLLGEV